jgi:hypothetical protein
MDVESTDIVKVVRLPHLFHQARSGDYLARVKHKNLEQPALQRGKMAYPVWPCNLAVLHVEPLLRRVLLYHD